MKQQFQKPYFIPALILGVLFVGLLVVRNGLAWTSPTVNPPGGSGVLKASGGNVGIGTATPGAKFEVVSGSAYPALFKRNASDIPLIPYSDSAGSGITNTNPYTSGALLYFNGNQFYFYNGSSANVVINSSGNVGIGTTAPGYKLDVSGTINGTSVLNPTYAP